MEKEEQGQALDVFEHAAQSLDVWAAIAWSKLGLSPDIMDGTIGMDLAQAKAAIDIAAAFAGVLETHLDADDRRRVQGLVRDLRINFVQKSTEGT
ncbi:DUF1844 domain-containing protein [bacterium]|nr:MAG: DUF1844 domain-containing protein [bacterium]